MFDIERWQEIFDTIRKNKLRSFLTGLSVASGIFILVILLGFGQGLQNGVAREFEEDAATKVSAWPGTTSIEYKGLNPGRDIQFVNKDFEAISSNYGDAIQHGTARIYLRNVKINYKSESLVYDFLGANSQFQFVENTSMVEGRFINLHDEQYMEKVVVIGRKIRDEVFTDVDSPIGEFIDISGIKFKVVGVFSELEEQEEERIIIPNTTAQLVLNAGNNINSLEFTVPPVENFEQAVKEAKAFENNLRDYLLKEHLVSADDEAAIEFGNALEQAKRYYGLMSNIKLFFWFVGICTIIAGVVGVSNIMLIVVRERTREIGIRKALGAKPWSIVGMILQESIFITAISGFSGLITSMAILELLGPNIQIDFIINPSLNFNVAFTTVMVLIFAGTLAGFVPAWRAAKVQVIESLRDE
ncbi:MAG: ABC transporter permease [Bacteroidota bacterium]